MGDGIVRVDPAEGERLAEVFVDRLGKRSLEKFVPASGAASRMFKSLSAYVADADATADSEVRAVLEGIDDFAFADRWKQAAEDTGVAWTGDSDGRDLLAVLLGEQGLDYARFPKALLPFHRYPGGSRTAIEEHLVEAARYARDAAGRCRLSFTVSPEHRGAVSALLDASTENFERRFGVSYGIELSEQNPATDSVAVDRAGEPFREENGALVFRPAGHGALIENVAKSDADVVFIKNIDNVAPESGAEPTFFWKKVLGGYLLELQAESFRFVRRLADESGVDQTLEHAARFVESRLGVAVGEHPRPADRDGLRARLLEALDRPLRVCGMVRNTGEPGGGPFWVRDRDGSVRRQIVETSEIDPRDVGQREVLSSATHFNPVDLVCAVRNADGDEYDLSDYVDPDVVFIVEKSHRDGRPLRSLELPGLWNGAMSRWNTVFVEVPIETFHPVKRLSDLLRPAHRGLGSVPR